MTACGGRAEDLRMLPRQGPLAGRGSHAPEATGPPPSLTRLIGRSQELDELLTLCCSQRLLTLTGAGGSGKTRLASELAQRRICAGVDCVNWVELSPCNDPSLVAQQVAASLALRETAERNPTDALVSVLREDDRLLILDNCEHVIDGAAQLVEDLLRRCPFLRILTTSREPLGVSGERVWLVPPLAITTEAVELFLDRAMAIDPSFEVDGSNSTVIEEICRRLDGIPLAIELAAARVRVLTPEQIAARLEDRFSILSGGSRSTITRHRTLRGAIDWSFTLLSPVEQTLLERLSIFSGSFSLEAVEAICSEEPIERGEILDLLAGLVDKSLVVANTRERSARYWLLESIREYARERLTPAVREALLRRHAEAFLALAKGAVPELMNASVSCLARLDPDHDNIRAALAWSLEHEPDRIALPLTAAFRWYWYYRINWSEGLRWITRALESSSDEITADRAATATGAGALAGYLGDITRGREYLEEAAGMWRAVGDERHLAYTLSALSHLLAGAGELERATLLADESIALVRRSGTPWDLGYCLTNAASFVAQSRGDLEEADRHLEEAERIWSADEHPLGLPFVLNARALMALRRDDPQSAARFARSALQRTRHTGDVWFSSRSLRVIAYTAADLRLSAKLIAASDAMLRSIAAGILPYEMDLHETLMEKLRSSLPAEELEACLSEGAGMTLAEACEASLDVQQHERAQSAAVSEARPTLHVRDLGPLQILLAGEPLREARTSGRACELLVFLLQHPAGCTREEVGVAFWPDASTDAVKNSFHVTLHRLRKMLGTANAVCTDSGRYRVAMQHESDSRRFEQEMTAALRKSKADPQLVGPLDAALSLYGGDFLQGEEVGEWCLIIRGHLRRLYLEGLFALGEGLEAKGRYAEAADAYVRLLAREPLHEAACRQLMICHARTGARLQSMKVYRSFEQRLREDLSASPESETSELFRKLKKNESV